MVTSSLHHSGERVWLDEEVEKVLQRKKDIEALEKVSVKDYVQSAHFKSHTQYCNDAPRPLSSFYLLSTLYVVHVILNTRPSCFSACNIEKLGVAWGRG